MDTRLLNNRLAIANGWPPADRLPPVDGDLLADRWQHQEEGACPHGWSSEQSWLCSADDFTGLDYDNLY